MGGEGSGRRPDPIKEIFKKEAPIALVDRGNTFDLPNHTGLPGSQRARNDINAIMTTPSNITVTQASGSPNVAGLYFFAGFYEQSAKNIFPMWKRGDRAYTLWFDYPNVRWKISTAQGTSSPGYFQNGTSHDIEGTSYFASGTYTGTPSVNFTTDTAAMLKSVSLIGTGSTPAIKFAPSLFPDSVQNGGFFWYMPDDRLYMGSNDSWRALAYTADIPSINLAAYCYSADYPGGTATAGHLMKTLNGDGTQLQDSGYSVADILATVGAQNVVPLADFYTTVSNTGTGSDENLYSYTIPANTLAAFGDKLIIQFSGIVNPLTVGNIQIKVVYGSTTVFDTGSLGVANYLGTLNNQWDLKLTAIYAAMNKVRFSTSTVGIKSTDGDYVETGEDPTNNLGLTLTVNVSAFGAAGDVSAVQGYVQWHKHA